MPTGPTAACLPTGWATMATTESHSVDILKFPIGWKWSGAPTDVVGTGNGSGDGLFGFMVFIKIIKMRV